jgi:hypothetical protein
MSGPWVHLPGTLAGFGWWLGAHWPHAPRGCHWEYGWQWMHAGHWRMLCRR